MLQIPTVNDQLAFFFPGEMAIGSGSLVSFQPVHKVLEDLDFPRELINGGGGVFALVNALETKDITDMDLLASSATSSAM